MIQSEVLADVFPPVELEVGLNKVACDIDEVIDAVLLSLSDFNPSAAIKKVGRDNEPQISGSASSGILK